MTRLVRICIHGHIHINPARLLSARLEGARVRTGDLELYTIVWPPGPGSVGLVSRSRFLARSLRGSRFPASIAPFSARTVDPALHRAFSCACGRRGRETAECGGTELRGGRQLIPYAFSEEFLGGCRSFRFCGCLLLKTFVGGAAAVRRSCEKLVTSIFLAELRFRAPPRCLFYGAAPCR